jgi:hypothetical protein
MFATLRELHPFDIWRFIEIVTITPYNVSHLWVHVLLAIGVLYPMRKLRRPAWAIMIPLSMQNLQV